MYISGHYEISRSHFITYTQVWYCREQMLTTIMLWHRGRSSDSYLPVYKLVCLNSTLSKKSAAGLNIEDGLLALIYNLTAEFEWTACHKKDLHRTHVARWWLASQSQLPLATESSCRASWYHQHNFGGRSLLWLLSIPPGPTACTLWWQQGTPSSPVRHNVEACVTVLLHFSLRAKYLHVCPLARSFRPAWKSAGPPRGGPRFERTYRSPGHVGRYRWCARRGILAPHLRSTSTSTVDQEVAMKFLRNTVSYQSQ